MPNFSEEVANTGIYVFLCKARILLFPEQFVRQPGERFLRNQKIRPHALIMKDDVLLSMVHAMVDEYKNEFCDLEKKYFGNTWLFDHFQTKGNAALEAPTSKPLMENALLLTILTREKFFRKQSSELIKTHGVKQILILGSGLDTFAVRKIKYTQDHNVKFFEIDNKEPLGLKGRLLKQLYGTTNATYVEGNYVKDPCFEALKEKGFDTAQPTLVVWGGNTMYLTPDQVASVMRQLKLLFEHNADLYMTFDYLMPDASVIEVAKEADKRHQGNYLENMLEGFKREFGIDFSPNFHPNPNQLSQFCQGLGFTLWKNQHMTAENHLKFTGYDENPLYTEKYYGHVTVHSPASPRLGRSKL